MKNLRAATQLDQDGIRLLQLLVSMLDTVKPDNPNTFISYGEAHQALGLPLAGRTAGASLQTQGLTNLALWTVNTGKPAITGLIVNKETLMPGTGYFELFERNSEDFNWWFSEIKKSKEYDWNPYLDTSSSASVEKGDRWSQDELKAAVITYLQMLSLEKAGTPYTKSEHYRRLADTYGRTTKSFEYRMQNISYVLALMGRDWISGLKPAKNVGKNNAVLIERLILEAEGTETPSVVGFEIDVRENLKKGVLSKPQGSRKPKVTTTSSTQYQRDSSVKAWVLNEANGICECCSSPAPFRTAADDLPYLEVHHVRQLAQSGSDTISNAVAICPNCHRALHYSMNAKELTEKLYGKIPRLIRE